MIKKLVQEHQLSERRACRLVGLSRDSYRSPPQPNVQNQALKDKIVEIAHVRRRFGYRRVHDLLRCEFPGVTLSQESETYPSIIEIPATLKQC
jgi:putative transposase